MHFLVLRCFGNPQALLDNKSIHIKRKKTLALLLYLNFHKNSLSRDNLADIFWPDLDRDHARANLRNVLSECRKMFTDNIISVNSDSINLNCNIIKTDVESFLSGCDSNDLEEQENSILLSENEFLQGFALPSCKIFDDWQFEFSQYIISKRIKTLEKVFSAYNKAGAVDKAIPMARKLIAEDPYKEDHIVHLLRLLSVNNEITAANREYEIYKRRLGEGDYDNPSPQLVNLVKEISRRKNTAKESSQPVKSYLINNKKKKVIKPVLVITAALILVFVSVYIFYYSTKQKQPVTIAVLPFRFLCDDPEAEYFAESFTIDMINAIAQDPFFTVPPYRSVSSYTNSIDSIKQIGRELNAEYLVDGITQKHAEYIRFSVQLIDIKHDKCIWTGCYDCTDSETIQTQDEVIHYFKQAIKSNLWEISL